MYTDFRDQNGNPMSVATVMEAIKRPVITHEVAFELYHGSSFSPFFFFNEDDIVRGSLVITNSCASDGIKLGSVNIGMLKVTVKNDQLKYLDSPNDLIDCNLSPGYKIKIDNTTTATVMGGTYFVKEVEQLREGIKLTCYDGMSKLDEPFTLGTITGTPYQILTQATTACNVPLKSTQAEIEALPNGTRTFTLHSDNDCKTWRDVLSYLSMLMGCFVTFARYTYGVLALPGLVVRPFGNGKENPDDTVTDVHRYKGAKFSIFDTEYKAIELTAYAVDGEDTIKKGFTYAETTGVTGQTIKLGYNPFIQADTPEADLTQTQRDILHELLTQIDKYAYTPMQISLPVGFIYDLGDVIKCTGGLANTGFAGGYTEDCYCCISNYTYTYGKEFRIKTLESKAAKARVIVSPPVPPTPSEYLPYTISEILCEATVDNYDQDSNSWGTGTKPYQMDARRGKVIDGDDVYISYDESLNGAEDVNLTDIPEGGTIYIVAKVLSFSDNYGAFIAFGHHDDRTQIPAWLAIQNSEDAYSTYDVTTNAGGKELVVLPNKTTNYNVYAISADNAGNISWYTLDYERHSQLLNHGTYATMSYVYNNYSPCHCAIGVKYFAVVRGAESATIIRNNIAHLADIFIPIENNLLSVHYAFNQIGEQYTVTDGENPITGVFDSNYDLVLSLSSNKTYTVSVEGITYGQITTRRSLESYELYAYTPDTMRIYTGYNDNKYVITMGDGETYNIPFETARGRVTQNIHEYTYGGVLIRIEFSATETRTNAVTGTIYFNGSNPFTFSADAKGSNPSYGVDKTIQIPLAI